MSTSCLVTVARRKKRMGEPLSSEEVRELRGYARRFVKLSTKVYFESSEQRREFREKAKQQQFRSFSAWILAMTKLGASGKLVEASLLAQLEKQLDKARGDFEHERGLAEEYRQKVRQLTAELEPLRRKVQEYAEKIDSYHEEYAKIIQELLRENRQ